MTLIVHAVLAVIVIGLIIWSNPSIFRRPASGPAVSALELLYYAIGIVSVVLGGVPVVVTSASLPGRRRGDAATP